MQRCGSGILRLGAETRSGFETALPDVVSAGSG